MAPKAKTKMVVPGIKKQNGSSWGLIVGKEVCGNGQGRERATGMEFHKIIKK